MYINPEASSLVEYSMSIKSGSKHTPVLWKSFTSFDLFCMSQLRVTYSTTQKNLHLYLYSRASANQCWGSATKVGADWFYVCSLVYLLISFVKFITILAYIFPKFCFFINIYRHAWIHNLCCLLFLYDMWPW